MNTITTTTTLLARPCVAAIACGLALGLTACGSDVAPPAQQLKIDQATSSPRSYPPELPLTPALDGSADERRMPGAVIDRVSDSLP